VSISFISAGNVATEMKNTDLNLHLLGIVVWYCFIVALMTFLAATCSAAVNECNRSPVIVQKIMLRNDIDREMMKEMYKDSY
jgi:cytochrome bd-type quinol oxidase subunit 1